MLEKIINQFFDDFGTHKNMVLSTAYGSEVHSRMMSIVCLDKRFYFQTDATFEKCLDIETNNNVSLCIDNVSITGLCKKTGVPSENNEFCLIFKTFYPKAYELYTASENEVLYEVIPKVIKCWTYENSNPYIELLDFDKRTYYKKLYVI